MADLSETEDSRLRRMAVSRPLEQAGAGPPGAGMHVSHSCPDLAGIQRAWGPSPHSSLPDHLVTERVLGAPPQRRPPPLQTLPQVSTTGVTNVALQARVRSISGYI